MANFRIFSAVNTKLLAMQAKLLKEEDYIRLIELPNNEAQIQYLDQHTHYKGMVDTSMRVDEVELMLSRKRYADLSRLRFYFGKPYQRFYEALLLRMMVEEVKLILRGIRSEEDMDILMLQSILLDYFGDSHPIFRFDKNSTLPSYIENLKDTPFYEVLIPYADDTGPRTLFYMEMVLDRYYFKELEEAAKDLDKEDRKLIAEHLGTDVDLKNIEFMYRGKKFYDLLPQEMENLAIPGGFVLNAADVRALANAPLDEFESIILDTKYDFLLLSKEDVDLEMFRELKRYQYLEYRKHRRSNDKNIMVLLSYLHITEFEIRDIIAILEGKRYQMEKRQINRFLIRQVDESKL